MLELEVPRVGETTDADFEVELSQLDGPTIAMSAQPCAIVPDKLRDATPRRLSVHDPLGVWELGARLEADGHELATGAGSDLIVASELSADILGAVERGAHLLLLARSHDALPAGLRLERPVRIQPRWPDPSRHRAELTWTGDWIGAFSWITPQLAPGVLPLRAPLDFTYAEVLPDHVMTGYSPAEHAEEITAGMFVGWIHAPVALAWSFPHGRGRMTITTLHVAPEQGPVATVLRSALVASA